MKKILLFSTFIANGFICNAQTITDVDGNTYKTVTIGSQIWMTENLKTTKLRDGTDIPFLADHLAWVYATAYAYCTYNNTANADTINTYGRLYNWHTVNTGMLCPEGWHVPSDVELEILTDYLGGEEVAGGNLKEVDTAHWHSPNSGASNSSGFTALPSGVRDYSGFFYGIGTLTYWWSSTNGEVFGPYIRSLDYRSSRVGLGYSGILSGLSVRCLKGNVQSSISNSVIDEITIYPNPSKENIVIKDDMPSNSFVEILNLQGENILSIKNVFRPIDISRLGKGVYIIKIVDSEKIKFAKFIKE